MAMKMFNKFECEYKSGYIVHEGEVVCIDNEIVDLLNKLDTDVQRAQHNQNEETCCPSFVPVKEFVPVSEHGAIYPEVKAKTPELDKKEEQAKKIMDELDAIADASKANEYFESIRPLFAFVNDEFIVSSEQATQHRFDLPVIGNPLNMSKEDIFDWVMIIFG